MRYARMEKRGRARRGKLLRYNVRKQDGATHRQEGGYTFGNAEDRFRLRRVVRERRILEGY